MYSARRGRGCAAAVRTRWRAGAALAGLALALCIRLPRDHSLVAYFPQHTPKHLAHFLADFSNYPNLYSHIESWSIEDETGNYTSWRYVASYRCGARCAGRATVTAHEDRAPPAHRTAAAVATAAPLVHGEALVHRLLFNDVHCTRLPFLTWPQFCEEIEVESVITAAVAGKARGGSRLEERARQWCGALRLLVGGCAPRHAREAHMRELRQAL